MCPGEAQDQKVAGEHAREEMVHHREGQTGLQLHVPCLPYESMCGYVHMCAAAQEGQKGESDTLELQGVVSHWTWWGGGAGYPTWVLYKTGKHF